MITIQELGLSILGGNPLPFYFISGQEYGVIESYISKLESTVGSKVEHDSVTEVIDLMNVNHLVPLDRALHVVRYDDAFASQLNDKLATRIRKTKMVGVLLCTFSSESIVSKIDKYLPEYTGVVSGVDIKFVQKYLHNDFPKLDDRSISIAAKYANNYGHARTICRSMSALGPEALSRFSEQQLSRLFGIETRFNEQEMRIAIASRSFRKLVGMLDSYEGELSLLHYTILNTLLELEKIKSSKYSNSPLRDYAKNWKIEDIYYMFMHTYSELQKLRSGQSSNAEDSLIYLFALLPFSPIPSPEVINAF